MVWAYYNENDPQAAQWLRELIKAGVIAPGDVDDRSILEVQPADLRGYAQCHFFAGIGGWSYALRLAGWPDGWPTRSTRRKAPHRQRGMTMETTADERYDRIHAAADALGLYAENGMVQVPSITCNYYMVDCTAIDPDRLLLHLLTFVQKAAYDTGQDHVRKDIRRCLGITA